MGRSEVVANNQVSPGNQLAAERAIRLAQALVENVGKVLEGKREAVELAVTSLLARGHLLVEDVPGVGKTTLARALARSLGVDFTRLQFTSDLMPADVLGGNVLDPASGTFRVPARARCSRTCCWPTRSTAPRRARRARCSRPWTSAASPSTAQTHVLEQPFFVLATQNPEEFYGTYPLPESQLDRFLLRIHVGYPAADIERQILMRRRGRDPTESAGRRGQQRRAARGPAQRSTTCMSTTTWSTTCTPSCWPRARASCCRSAPPRAVRSRSSARCARGRWCSGRTYVTPDDVQALAVPALAHRVRVAALHDASVGRHDAERVIREFLAKLPVPV